MLVQGVLKFQRALSLLGSNFASVGVLRPTAVSANGSLELGTTLGMMLANIPAVLIGDRMAGRLPVSAIRVVAALVFAALGIATLLA